MGVGGRIDSPVLCCVFSISSSFSILRRVGKKEDELMKFIIAFLQDDVSIYPRELSSLSRFAANVLLNEFIIVL